MNRQGKMLSVLFLLTFLAGWYSLGVFAQSNSKPYFPELPVSDSPVETSSASVPEISSSSPPAGAPSGSRQSSSSRKPGRTANRVSSSSSDFSAPESDESSFGISSEESSGITLPSVGSVPENDPLSSVVNNQENSRRMNWIGILSWACIALGIIVVLIVMLSNRRPPRGMGRKRYRRAKRPKKRLLNDKYYRDINNRY